MRHSDIIVTMQHFDWRHFDWRHFGRRHFSRRHCDGVILSDGILFGSMAPSHRIFMSSFTAHFYNLFAGVHLYI